MKKKTTRRWPHHVSAYVSEETGAIIAKLRDDKAPVSLLARVALESAFAAEAKKRGVR